LNNHFLSNHLFKRPFEPSWASHGSISWQLRKLSGTFFGGFYHFCGGSLLSENHFFGWHWCPGDSLLKGKIGVVASRYVGNVGRGVAVVGEFSWPWSSWDCSQPFPMQAHANNGFGKDGRFLSCLFVESLPKLRGKKTRRFSIKILRQNNLIWGADQILGSGHAD
jgi:hypothetical protein